MTQPTTYDGSIPPSDGKPYAWNHKTGTWQEQPEFWVRFDPQGCAQSSVHHDEVGRDADEAHRRFVPRAEKRRREIKQGWTIRAVTQTEFSAETVQCFYGKCSHHPAPVLSVAGQDGGKA